MYLGLDIGTSGVKALLIDGDQRVVGSALADLTVERPHPGWSEQDPQSWIDATKDALIALGQQHDLSAVKGIGVSGQMHGATLLDERDQVLRPCILWNDTRSHVEAAEMDSDPDFRQVSGNIVFPGFTAPKLRWVKNNESDVFKKTAKILLPKDFVRLWLTGNHVSDVSDAAGTSWLDTGTRSWSETLLARSDLNLDQMPGLVEGSDLSGTTRSAISEFGIPTGTPVAGGAGDNAATAIGLGVTSPNDAFISLGTSGVLFASSEGYHPDPDTALHTFCHAIPNTWHQMGVILSATDSLNWLSGLIGTSPEALTKPLGKLQEPGRTLFLPYLGGERTPHNNAIVRGAFLGLEHATDSAAATRAVLEGVVFAFKDCADAMAKTGSAPKSIIAAGGGSQSHYWLEGIATMLNAVITVPKVAETGAAFGAARLGLMAAEGLGPEIATPPATADAVEPNPNLLSAFEDTHHRYTLAYKAIKDLS